MRRFSLLIALLVAVTACGSPSVPLLTSSGEQGAPATPSEGFDSSLSGDPVPPCPPPDAGDGFWLCTEPSTPDPEAEQERLAEMEQWSDEEADRAEAERLRQVMADQPELAADDDPVTASGDLPADRGTLLVRTDFTHEQQWQALVTALTTPSPEGFLPYLITVEHDRWRDASVTEIVYAAPPYPLIVLADTTALSTPEMPVLVVEVHEGAVRELRVAPEALASVENNLSIANMDWDDFASAADPDGVFRGFD